VWAATFSFTQLRRRGVHASLSAYALGVTWTFSALALGAVALVGVDLAGSDGPAAPFRIAATVATAVLVLLVVGFMVLLRSGSFRAFADRRLARVASHPRVAAPLARCLGWVRWVRSVPLGKAVLARCVGAAILNWIFDCGCLICSILAVGGHVPWQGVLAAYGLTQLAAVLPITPGGIGVVEGTLSLLLISYHVPAATAVAAVLLYRILSFWILVAFGWATVGGLVALQRRDARIASNS
jgi:putative heme transporter